MQSIKTKYKNILIKFSLLIQIVSVFVYTPISVLKWHLNYNLTFASNNDLKTIEIPKSEFHLIHWKHSKEFEFKGNFYDIKSKIVFKDRIVFSAKKDNEENFLLKLIKNNLKNNKKHIAQYTDWIILSKNKIAIYTPYFFNIQFFDESFLIKIFEQELIKPPTF